MSAIDLYARATAGFDGRMAHALAVLQSAATDHAGAIVQATSLGAEDMVVTDFIARHRLPISVATLDSGKLHPQTLELIPAIEQRYGLVVERFRPRDEAVSHFVSQHGERAMYDSIDLRKACCQVRKLEPLARLLADRTAWVTGLRREQSDHRADVPHFELDAEGREKFYPLADWSEADAWQYVMQYEVPYNPLHDAFFPSIGCAPCTRAVSLGEDHRAGRWWWEQEGAKECGLHMRPEPVAA